MEKYRRVRVLGQGNCSKVYLVQDSNSGENYVVKQIEAPLSGQQRDSALREAALLRVLSHPNIVGYKEAFVTRSGFICLIMEYAQGGDMFHHLQQRAPIDAWIPEPQVLQWMAQLCCALHYLHERNVIHRDIKARNIFLRMTGEAQLGDFGISAVVDSPDEQLSSAIGTPSYASPERMRKRPYGASADIWSLGVVFYEICALRKPFEGDTLQELAERIVAGQYDPLDERHYSHELRSVVSRMLAYEPSHRPTAGCICDTPLLFSCRAEDVTLEDVSDSLPPLVVPVHLQHHAAIPMAPQASIEELHMAVEPPLEPFPDTRPVSAGVESAISTEGMETLTLSPHGHRDHAPPTPPWHAASPPPLAEHCAWFPDNPDFQVPEDELLLDFDASVGSNMVENGEKYHVSPKAAWTNGSPHERGQHKQAQAHGGFGHALLHGARRLFGWDGSSASRAS